MVAGNLTSEETELVRADLKLVKAAGTDGFSITFYVFLKGKKMSYIYMRHFYSLAKCRVTSYNIDAFWNSIDVLILKK